jgi:hypothetical protein
MVLIEQGSNEYKRHPEGWNLDDKQLTPETLFHLLEDHPRVHYLKAFYQQLIEMFGKAQADREICDVGNPDLHIDANYIRFMIQSLKSKKPIEKRITNIFRFRGPDNKEYIKWSGTLMSETKLGEPISTSVAGVGYGETPTYKQTFDRKELEWRPSLQIAKTKPVCTIEWNAKNIKELSKSFYDETDTTRTRFYFIDYNNRKQACPKEISTEEWRQWWETLPRKEMLAKMTELEARRKATPRAV